MWMYNNVIITVFAKEWTPVKKYMRKLCILLVVLCMLAGNATVSAETIHEADTISPEETKVVTVPQPEGTNIPQVIDFTQDFEFVPQENGIYRFFVSHEEQDRSAPAYFPYNFYLDAHYWSEYASRQNGETEGSAPGAVGTDKFRSLDYVPLLNGIEFDGWAGEIYRLRFVYSDNRGRYPEFTFSLVRGDHHYREDTIAYGETKVFSVPQPEGEVDPDLTYFTQDFVFVPEKSRTCRVLVSCEEDESNPYRFSLEECLPFERSLYNGDEIEVIAGEPVHLRFQYPIHDGRYPEFTIRITHNREPIRAGVILYPGIVILACVIAVMAPFRLRKKKPDIEK